MLDRTNPIPNDVSDDIGPASSRLKPKVPMPGHSSTKHGGQSNNETHACFAAASPATAPLETMRKVPGSSSLRGRKAVRRTMLDLNPNRRVSGDNSIAGQIGCDAHRIPASKGRRRAAPPNSGGHHPIETQLDDAVAGDDHGLNEPQGRIVIADHITNVAREIQPLWRRRQIWHRAEKSLTLQMKGQCRGFVGGDKKDNKVRGSALFDRIVAGDTAPEEHSCLPAVLPLLCARNELEPKRLLVEKHIERLAKSLPVWPWVKGVYGVGALTLAGLVGETTNIELDTNRTRTISDYSTVSKLWKRMGGAVINGERQRKKKDKDDAAAHGFDPSRGAVLFNLGGALIGGRGKGVRPRVGEDIEARDDWSPYQKLFVRLLRLEVTRVTETWNGPDQAREPVERKGVLYESFGEWATNRIRRRIAKQFLCDLLVAWRRASPALKPRMIVPAATSSGQPERSAQHGLRPTEPVPSASHAAAEAVSGGQDCDEPHISIASPSSSAKADRPRAKAGMSPTPIVPGANNSGKPERRGTMDNLNPRESMSRATLKLVAAKVAKRKATVNLEPANRMPCASTSTAGRSAGRRTSTSVKPTLDLSAATLEDAE